MEYLYIIIGKLRIGGTGNNRNNTKIMGKNSIQFKATPSTKCMYICMCVFCTGSTVPGSINNIIIYRRISTKLIYHRQGHNPATTRVINQASPRALIEGRRYLRYRSLLQCQRRESLLWLRWTNLVSRQSTGRRQRVLSLEHAFRSM